MEQIIYELRPFLYIVGAALAQIFNHPPSRLANFSALLLTACALVILNWRRKARATNPRR